MKRFSRFAFAALLGGLAISGPLRLCAAGEIPSEVETRTPARDDKAPKAAMGPLDAVEAEPWRKTVPSQKGVDGVGGTWTLVVAFLIAALVILIAA